LAIKQRVKKLERKTIAEGEPKLLVDWGDGKAEDAGMMVISWGEDDQIRATRPKRKGSHAQPTRPTSETGAAGKA
jgi:hypothetical protein